LNWIDHLLTYLGVHHVTPIKEVWVFVSLAVLILQLFLFVRYICKELTVCFGTYLLAAAIRDVSHYFTWWHWSGELMVSFFAVLATAEACLRATFCIRRYQRSYARHMICFAGVLAVSTAALQVPMAYPKFEPGVYFTRLYTEVLCAGCLLCSVVYVWWNGWRKQFATYGWHAAIMLVWFADFTWADRHMESGDAWFPVALAKLAIQGTCLVAWCLLEPAFS
jgi:hypothetical protein